MRTFGDQFKEAERFYGHKVTRGGYLIVRLDGKAFHTFTRGCRKPFDSLITNAFVDSVMGICKDSDIPVKFAYTQSDEVSLLIPNGFESEPWFGGKIQKIVSVSASVMTAYFNDAYYNVGKYAFFDARVFQLFENEDVHDYFLWRKMDANRNAISALAQSLYPHKQLQGVSTRDLAEKIAREHPERLPIDTVFYNGAHFKSKVVKTPVDYIDRRTNRVETVEADRRVWTVHTEGMLDDLDRTLVR